MLSSEKIFLEAEKKLFVGIDSSGFKNGLENLILHGTTCIAIIHKGGLTVATDGRATANNLIWTETFDKIFQLDRHSLLAVSGSAGFAQKIAKLLQAFFSFESDKAENEYIPPKTKVNIVAQHMGRNMSQLESLGFIMPIFATFDADRRNSGGRIFLILPDGTIKPESQFEAVGSGAERASEAISTALYFKGKSPDHNSLREVLSRDQAERIVTFALMEANKRDSATGYHVNMKTITGKGVESASPARIEEIKANILGGNLW